MKKSILVLLCSLCLLVLPVIASHIVGGEFELLHISGSNYRINMILYFDSLNGDPSAKDLSVTARIYRKGDNVKMMDVLLRLTSETRVLYTQPSCSNGNLVTHKLIYTTTVTLSDDQFNAPEGYYIVWERCCRNYGITNIYSENTQAGGRIYAGQTFYMEFPPVMKDGKPFINSSPHLFPPLNDYACPKRPYYINFGGVDDDNDSLVYSLVTPLNTQSGESFPFIGPAPYPDVSWRNPFSIKNITGGNPDMKITPDGFLTVTPKPQGLFVFAVACDQFRDGVKIGQTRRDFQMLVVDECPQADPPQIIGKKLTDSGFSYLNAMNVTFSNTINDTDRCIQVQVSDDDSDSTRDGQENITIKAIALNFKKDVSTILPAVTTATLINGSAKTFEICFDKCPFIENTPYQIGIVAYDDACSLPLTDTLRINVNIQPPPNDPPHFTTPDISETSYEGNPKKTWPIQAVDADGDAMTLYMLVRPAFNLDSAGMTLTTTAQKNDTLNASFTWDPKCTAYDFMRRSDFNIKLLVGSRDQCGFTHYDTMLVDLKMQLINSDPDFVISSLDINNPLINNSMSIVRGQQISLGLHGVEKNTALPNDLIQIKMVDAKGNVEPAGYVFSPVEGLGSAETTFIWNPDCSIFQKDSTEDNFVFTFSMTDTHCINPQTDTVVISLTIRDIDGNDKSFNPRNFISPNDDGWNDFFTMEGGIIADRLGTNAINSDDLINLPKDNCSGHFENIRIYDRWGKEMFKSDARDFRWYAKDAASGVYYYYMKFTNKEYKGTITVSF